MILIGNPSPSCDGRSKILRRKNNRTDKKKERFKNTDVKKNFVDAKMCTVSESTELQGTTAERYKRYPNHGSWFCRLLIYDVY